jgi:hypothetical protein
MAKRKDFNELAASIVRRATGEEEEQGNCPTTPAKNPAAVALGKLGGKKGGPGAKKLSARKRKQIATAAARARWGKKPSGGSTRK